MSSLLPKLCLVISLSLSLSSINAQSFFNVLEKTLDDYTHLDLNYVNYMLSSESRSSDYQIIQIQDPIQTAIDGQVSFAISDNSIPSQTLHSRKVKIDSDDDRQIENKHMHIFDVQGVYIGSVANRDEIFKMNLNAGIYLIRSENNKDGQAEKIFISNDK